MPEIEARVVAPDPRVGMKAVISNTIGHPCVIYWTGQVRLHVGVVTWCRRECNAKDGVLQVPDDVPCCTNCEDAIRERRYPKL
jgi:hypothetical protein